MSIDKKLLILKVITPINLLEEKKKFIDSKGEYVPQFKYYELDKDLELLKKEVLKIEIPEIPLSNIYKRKKEEILNKINFLKAFKDENIDLQLESSMNLF